MSGMGRCATCPVPPDLECRPSPGQCRRAAEPGQDAYRAVLIRHAKVRAAQAEILEASRRADPETARLRRAAKPRIPLGAKPKGR